MLQEAFAGQDTLICYAVKANSNQAVLADAGPPRRRHGCRLGGRAAPRARGRRAGRRRSSSPASARRARRWPSRSTKASSASTSSPSPSSKRLSEVARALGRTARIALRVNPDVDAKTHAKISTGKAENKFGIPFARCAAALRQGAQAAGHRRRRHPYAHRQPDHRPRAVPQRVPRCCVSWRRPASATATRSAISTSAAASGCPTVEARGAAAPRRLCALSCKEIARRPRAQARARARPCHRRQCRHPRFARAST